MPIGDRPAEPLNDHEVQALIAATGTTLIGVRSKALIVIMWRGGLRCGEALALRDADIDMRGGTIRILHGKGAKAGPSGSTTRPSKSSRPGSTRAINASRQQCTPVHQDRRPDVRPLRRPHATTRPQSRHQRTGPRHRLRHTHACELAAEGVPVNVISRQLGHSSSAVTAVYIDHLAPADVIAVMRKRTWSHAQSFKRPSS